MPSIRIAILLTASVFVLVLPARAYDGSDDSAAPAPVMQEVPVAPPADATPSDTPPSDVPPAAPSVPAQPAATPARAERRPTPLPTPTPSLAPQPVAPSPAAIATYRERSAAAGERRTAEERTFREELTAQREAVRVRIVEKQERLAERLTRITSAEKREVVQRVDRQFDRINTTVTRRLVASIAQLQHVLGRVEERMLKAEANGADVRAVRSARTAAQQSLTAAQAATAEQAGRTYEILVGGDATLRSDAQRVRQALKTDLSAAQAQVRAARDAVQRAATILAQIPRVDAAPIAP